MLIRVVSDLLGQAESSVALLYHDIVERDNARTSGVVTDGSWRYKVPPKRFRSHLGVIERSPFTPGVLTDSGDGHAVYLTFDDGGRTAMTAAEMLEEYGFRGNFFIITERVGRDGYLTWEEIERLDNAGHLIGSHTVTHANLLTSDDLEYELCDSKREIEERLGNCRVLSIPKGAYDETVFKAAWEAGYSYVLTSEPERIRRLDCGSPIGRWNVWHDTDGSEVSRILRAEPRYYLRTIARWKSLKTLKRLVGRERFIAVRDHLLGDQDD